MITCFTYPWKTLSHFIISSLLVFCNGLTPFYGYASRTFFTKKKGLGMLHVVFHGNSATYHCWIASIGFLLLLWFILHKRGRLIACSHSNNDGNGRLRWKQFVTQIHGLFLSVSTLLWKTTCQDVKVVFTFGWWSPRGKLEWTRILATTSTKS